MQNHRIESHAVQHIRQEGSYTPSDVELSSQTVVLPVLAVALPKKGSEENRWVPSVVSNEKNSENLQGVWGGPL